MRNISFAITTQQFISQTKTVTRRVGWRDLKPGERLQAVEKCMGLKLGEKMKKLGTVRVLTVRREPLREMTDNPIYGIQECIREGFPNLSPAEFVAMFCKTHKDCRPETRVTRIEYEYELLL